MWNVLRMETKLMCFQMPNASDLLTLEIIVLSHGLMLFSTVFISGMFWQLRSQGQPTSPMSVWHNNKINTFKQKFFTVINGKTWLPLVFLSVQILFPFKVMITMKSHHFPLTSTPTQSMVSLSLRVKFGFYFFF